MCCWLDCLLPLPIEGNRQPAAVTRMVNRNRRIGVTPSLVACQTRGFPDVAENRQRSRARPMPRPSADSLDQNKIKQLGAQGVFDALTDRVRCPDHPDTTPAQRQALA